jgi:hypothetical protein
MLNRKVPKSVMHYIMLGPQAVEARLSELEIGVKRCRARISYLLRASIRLQAWGLGRLVSGLIRYFRSATRQTVRELNRERKVLKALVGGTMRTWEKQKTGPAPTI